MNPGMRRLRNNSQAERVDSRSSYTNDPFRGNYNASKNERAIEWQPGLVSPSYSRGSNYPKRPNHQNFHSRVNLNQSGASESWNSPRIQVESTKYQHKIPMKQLSRVSSGARGYNYNQSN